jgi:hypothetical protein
VNLGVEGVDLALGSLQVSRGRAPERRGRRLGRRDNRIVAIDGADGGLADVLTCAPGGGPAANPLTFAVPRRKHAGNPYLER